MLYNPPTVLDDLIKYAIKKKFSRKNRPKRRPGIKEEDRVNEDQIVESNRVCITLLEYESKNQVNKRMNTIPTMAESSSDSNLSDDQVCYGTRRIIINLEKIF